ncbi:hypothetical protein FB45DRAFT_871069 [Roridomyces roridus]|uniref:Uncharacterized protein n=1 Tax=Roridomyces roridus TaxID=1738132 RepID=A0AAD7BHT2_9AGAR|nr:hypothetical protein FB45DRAFT_871069 [Roridomyces roridus]
MDLGRNLQTLSAKIEGGREETHIRLANDGPSPPEAKYLPAAGDTQGATVLLTGAPLISLDKRTEALCGHDGYRGGVGSWALRDVSVEDSDPMSGEPRGQQRAGNSDTWHGTGDTCGTQRRGTEAPGRVGTLLGIHAQMSHVVVQSFKLTCSTPELSERLPLVAVSNIELVDDFKKMRRPEVDTHWVSAYDGAIDNAKASEIVCFRQTWVVSLHEFLVHVAEEMDHRMRMAWIRRRHGENEGGRKWQVWLQDDACGCSQNDWVQLISGWRRTISICPGQQKTEIIVGSIINPSSTTQKVHFPPAHSTAPILGIPEELVVEIVSMEPVQQEQSNCETLWVFQIFIPPSCSVKEQFKERSPLKTLAYTALTQLIPISHSDAEKRRMLLVWCRSWLQRSPSLLPGKVYRLTAVYFSIESISCVSLNTGVALVTGAGSARGIGKAITSRLAADGFVVAVNDVSGQCQELRGVAQLLKTKGPASSMHVADVSQEQQVKGMIEEVVDRHGSLDVMMANAGITMARKPPTQIAEGIATDWPCTASKFAVRGLAQSAALEFGQHGIGNLPNALQAHLELRLQASRSTLMHLESLKLPCYQMREKNEEETEQIWKEMLPLEVIGAPEDIASLVSFIASKESQFITDFNQRWYLFRLSPSDCSLELSSKSQAHWDASEKINLELVHVDRMPKR